MKALRFRSFAERISQIGFLFFACALAGGNAFGSESLDELKQFAKDCKESARKDNDLAVFVSRSDNTLKEDFDPAKQCVANRDGDTPAPLVSHNHAMVKPEDWRGRPAFLLKAPDEKDVRKLGACNLVYLTIRDLGKRYRSMSEEQCTEIQRKWKAVADCGNTKKCEEPYNELILTVGEQKKALKELQNAAEKYLTKAGKGSHDAKREYEKDLEKLKIELDKLAKAKRDGDKPATETLGKMERVPDRSELKPSNGNSRLKSLGEYLAYLSPTEINAEISGVIVPPEQMGAGLIREHVTAEEDAAKYREKMLKRLADATDRLEKWEPKLDTMLKNAQGMKSASENPLTKLPDGASALGALGAGKGMTGNPTPTPNLTGGASMAPSLAAVAAAGAAGAALSKFGGSSASSGEASPDGFQAPVTNQGVHGPGSSPLTGSAPVADSGSGLNGLTAIPEAKAGQEKAPEAAGGNYPAFGASDGSSRMASGSRKPAGKGPAAAAPKLDAASEESLSAFGAGGMTPRSASKSGNSPSPGAEVANLLGQMKNLFNFDEGGGMGAGPMGAGPMPGGPGAAPGAPGGAVASADHGEGDSEYEEGEEEGAYGEEGGAVQAAQFGRVDTTLFARVRVRHTRAMERGLVLYQLGERVE